MGSVNSKVSEDDEASLDLPGSSPPCLSIACGRLHLSLRQVQGDDHPGRWGVGGLLNSGKRSKCKLNFSCSAFTLTAKNSNCNKGSDFMKIGKEKFCEDNSPDVTVNGRTLNVLFRSNKRSKGGSGAKCTASCIDTSAPATTTTAAPTTTGNGASEVRQNILNDHFNFWRAFRDPLNGAWCDSLYPPDHPWMDPDKEDYEELTPCGEDNNFYSS